MPVVQARQLKTAAQLALVALLVPIGITLAELPTGGMRPWIRLVALLIVAGALGLVLRRLADVEEKVMDQARIGDELRASEAKFSGILSIAADAIISVDESQKIVHFNHGAEEIFGYTAAEAIGQPLSMLLPERFRETHDAHVDETAIA